MTSSTISSANVSFKFPIDAFIADPAFIRNFQFSSTNKNFYFNYGFMCGRAILILMVIWLAFCTIYSKQGFKMYTQGIYLYLMSYLVIAQIKSCSKNSFILQSFFYGIARGARVSTTNFLSMGSNSIFFLSYVNGAKFRHLSIYSGFDLMATLFYTGVNVIILILMLRPRRVISSKVEDELMSLGLGRKLGSENISLPKLIFNLENMIRMGVYLTHVSSRISRITSAYDYLILLCIVFNQSVSLIDFLCTARQIKMRLRFIFKEVSISLLMYLKFSIGIQAVLSKRAAQLKQFQTGITLKADDEDGLYSSRTLQPFTTLSDRTPDINALKRKASRNPDLIYKITTKFRR